MIQPSSTVIGRHATVIERAIDPVGPSSKRRPPRALPGIVPKTFWAALLGALSAGLLKLSRSTAPGHRFAARDEPGTAVLRDLGLDGERPSSPFDWVGFHQGSESAQLHRSHTQFHGWRGS